MVMGYILIFNMLLEGQIKLSRIFDHNFDKRTDRLYQPLRMAVQTMPTAQSTSTELHSKTGLAEMKCSQINISRAEQDLIKNSTFIPINKKLVQTDNPEKHIRARSRSYRTLSVEQRIGSPMAHEQFKQSVANPGNKVEIVYDYDRSNPTMPAFGKISEYYGAVTPSTLPRTRSATYVGGMLASMTIRPQRAETKMVKVQRRSSKHSSTSLQLKQGKEVKSSAHFSEPVAGEYYQNCKKYAFKNEMKEKPMRRLDKSNDSLEKDLIKERNMVQSDYKYNLFNLLDDPINSKCSNGLCHKNEIIASRIKKRW